MSNFTEVRVEELPLLQATAYEYRHSTGAKLIHFACDDDENQFAAIIPTVPTDETGAPHILEHCVLNGSKRYPDARSVGPIHATGGGAWTGWEYTWYFHESPSQEDFLKLVDYRCDSLFEPVLAYETFLHQAHHLEFTVPDDPTTPLLYRGVIYNEQKGILGHPIAVGWQEIGRALYPDQPYALEHGGTPLDVPTITYEQLKAFHQRHYHPAAAHFLSWGDVPLDDLLHVMDEALNRVPERPFTPTPFPDAQAPSEPVRHIGRMPIGADDDPTGRGLVLLAWSTTPAADPYESFLHDLLVEILRGTPMSPLPAALAGSRLGKAVAETYDRYGVRCVRHTVATGLDGCDAGDAEAVERVVMDTLNALANDGITDDAIDVALNALEYRRRTMTSAQGHQGSATGFWLEHVNTPWLSGGDPLAACRMDELLDRFASERRNGRPLEDRLRAWYIDNTFRATVIIEPDPGADVRLEREERRRLDEAAASLSDEDKQGIIEQTKSLAAFLANRSTPAENPSPEKIKRTRKDPPSPVRLDADGVPIFSFTTRTNQISYVDLVCDLGSLPDELWDHVRLFSEAVVRAGSDGRTPDDTASIIGTATGGIDTDVLVPVVGDGAEHASLLRLGGRAVERRQEELVDLVVSLLTSANFTPEMLRTTIDAALAHAEQFVFIDAPGYLRRLAGSHIRRSWALRDRLDGFSQLATMRRLAAGDDAVLAEAADKLNAIRDHIANRSTLDVVVTASGKEAVDAIVPPLSAAIGHVADGGGERHRERDLLDGPLVHEARTFGQPTAFNCGVWTIPGWTHDAGPALLVGGALAQRWVRTEVSQKGTAYSASADAYSDPGSLVCWSIRDPNVARTFGAFESSVRRLSEGPIDSNELASARLAASLLIQPTGTPPLRARGAFLRAAAGIDADAHRRLIERIDAVDADAIMAAAAEHIGEGARASLTSADMAERAGTEGKPFDVIGEV